MIGSSGSRSDSWFVHWDLRSRIGQTAKFVVLKKPHVSCPSRHAVSSSWGLWNTAGLQGAHKCHWINLSRFYDDFVAYR